MNDLALSAKAGLPVILIVLILNLLDSIGYIKKGEMWQIIFSST